MTRTTNLYPTVVVKRSNKGFGPGSVEADLLWESGVDEWGGFCHLSRVLGEGGWEYFLSWTDMEEHGGSYFSQPLSRQDLEGLRDSASYALSSKEIVT